MKKHYLKGLTPLHYVAAQWWLAPLSIFYTFYFQYCCSCGKDLISVLKIKCQLRIISSGFILYLQNCTYLRFILSAFIFSRLVLSFIPIINMQKEWRKVVKITEIKSNWQTWEQSFPRILLFGVTTAGTSYWNPL